MQSSALVIAIMLGRTIGVPLGVDKGSKAAMAKSTSSSVAQYFDDCYSACDKYHPSQAVDSNGAPTCFARKRRQSQDQYHMLKSWIKLGHQPTLLSNWKVGPDRRCGDMKVQWQ